MAGAVSATTWWGVSMSETFTQIPEDYTPAFTVSSGANPEQAAFDGLIAKRGLAVVYGGPGAGKTTWLVNMLHRWGREKVDQSGAFGCFKVVYIALEGADLVRRSVASHRLDWVNPVSWGESDPAILDPLRVRVVPLSPRGLRLLDRAAVDVWLQEVGAGRLNAWKLPAKDYSIDELVDVWWDGRTLKSPDVVVVDSLSRALAGADENDNGTMAAAVETLEHIRDTFDARLLVVVHHPAAGTTHLRGGSALLGAVDSSTYIHRKGDILTARNQKARAFADGTLKRYRRRLHTAVDLSGLSVDRLRMEFDELPAAETEGGDAKAPKGPSPAPLPSEPVALADVPAPQGEPRADSKAAEGESEPSPPTPPVHPANALQGRPAALWEALGLAPGESISTTEAMERLKSHPALEGVEARRRTVRLREAFDSFERRGLITRGVIQNPA